MHPLYPCDRLGLYAEIQIILDTVYTFTCASTYSTVYSTPSFTLIVIKVLTVEKCCNFLKIVEMI